MHQRALAEQEQLLKAQLEHIDKKLQGGSLPFAVLKTFKDTVDQVRTTLWAVILDDARTR